MPVTDRSSDLDEVGRIGADLIAPTLLSADSGKCVAVDVSSGQYEVDHDDYAAVHRLHLRVPNAAVWLGYAGPQVGREQNSNGNQGGSTQP